MTDIQLARRCVDMEDAALAVCEELDEDVSELREYLARLEFDVAAREDVCGLDV